jgi:transposase
MHRRRWIDNDFKPQMELGFMRYELTDCEWFAIKPLLPNKSRGVPRVDDRRVLNGIFWVLRSGAPWRDLPRTLGPYTTSYNSLRPLAAGWCLEPDHEGVGHNA